MKLTQQHKNILKLVGVFVGSLAAIFAFVGTARYIAPLLIALVFYYLSKPLSNFLKQKLKTGGKVAAAVTTVLILVIVVVAAVLVVLRVINEAQQMIVWFSANSGQISKNFTDTFQMLEDKLDLLHPKVSETLTAAMNSLISRVSTMFSSMASRTVSFFVALPRMIVFVIATAVCTFMVIKDRDRIYAFFSRNLPAAFMKNFESMKKDLFIALFGYIKAQLIMCSITFIELMVAFTILNVRYKLLLAVVIAIIDALPLFGCGLFLIPWTIYSFGVGDIRLGIGIGILYICTLSIRQMIEPRVLGNNIGVYPLLTLLSMYAGLQVWGVVGLFLGPLTVIILKGVMEFPLRGRSLTQFVQQNGRPDQTEDSA